MWEINHPSSKMYSIQDTGIRTSYTSSFKFSYIDVSSMRNKELLVYLRRIPVRSEIILHLSRTGEGPSYGRCGSGYNGLLCGFTLEGDRNNKDISMTVRRGPSHMSTHPRPIAGTDKYHLGTFYNNTAEIHTMFKAIYLHVFPTYLVKPKAYCEGCTILETCTLFGGV